MIRRFHRLILTLALVAAGLGGGVAPASAAKGWEPVKAERPEAKVVVRETEFEVRAARGLIMIQTNHPVQVKIFTILGRLVSSETVAPGQSQLQLPAHGVYIVKVGDITCKVAV